MVAKKARRQTGSARTSDEKLIARVQEKMPDLLTSRVSEEAFGAVVDNLIAMTGEERPHFYCRPCGKYHEKTHQHYADMKKRRAARRERSPLIN
jgi:hypothetical protein